MKHQQNIASVDLEDMVHNSTGRKVNPTSYHRLFMASRALYRAVAAGMRTTLFYGSVDVSNVVVDTPGYDRLAFKLGDEQVFVAGDEYNGTPSPILFDRIEMISASAALVPVGTFSFATEAAIGPVAATDLLPFKNSFGWGGVVWVDGVGYTIYDGYTENIPCKADGSSSIRFSMPGLYAPLSVRLARKNNNAAAYPLGTAYTTMYANGSPDYAALYNHSGGIVGYEILVP